MRITIKDFRHKTSVLSRERSRAYPSPPRFEIRSNDVTLHINLNSPSDGEKLPISAFDMRWPFISHGFQFRYVRMELRAHLSRWRSSKSYNIALLYRLFAFVKRWTIRQSIRSWSWRRATLPCKGFQISSSTCIPCIPKPGKSNPTVDVGFGWCPRWDWRSHPQMLPNPE